MMTGRCLCGAVTYRAADVHEVGACHCGMCRRWSGGPYFAAEPETVEWTGAAPATYRSSEWAERGFCAVCGSGLFYRLIETGACYLNPFTLDDPSRLAFVSQVHVEEKPALYSFADRTRMLTGEQIYTAYMAARQARAAATPEDKS